MPTKVIKHIGLASNFSQKDSNKLYDEIKDEILIQQKEDRKKRGAESERYDPETLNKESIERKKRKEETKKNLEIDNNNINKDDVNQKK